MSDADQDKDPPSASDTVHGDRRFGVEHGSIHKPIHTSVQYGYERVEDLIGVFQGTLKDSFSYARQGTPTTAALEAKISQLEQGIGTVCFSTRHGGAQRDLPHAAARRRPHGVEPLRLRQHQQPVRHAGRPGRRCHQGRCGLGGQRARRAAAGHAHGVRRDDRQPRHADPRPRGDRRAVPRTRPALRGGQHHHLARPLPAEDRRRGAGRQLADQDHRRPRRRAGRRRHRHGPVRLAGAIPTSRRAIAASTRASRACSRSARRGCATWARTLSPEQAHRISLGAETLALRVAQTSATALALARFLQAHPAVAAVHYPMLESHPQHALAAAALQGGLVAARLRTARQRERPRHATHQEHAPV